MHDHPMDRASRPSPAPATAAAADLDAALRPFRAAAMMAEVAQQALHEDPRFRSVSIRAGSAPGAIAIDGRVDQPQLRALLYAFAREWGGVSVDVEVAPTPSPGPRVCAAQRNPVTA